MRRGNQTFNVVQLRVEFKDNHLPVRALLRVPLGGSSGGGGGRRSVLQDNFCPALEDFVSDVQLPVDRQQECNFVLVDFSRVEPGNLAPGSGRVVTILKVLGSEDESSKEHAAAALKCAALLLVVGLFHGEIVLRDVGLNEDQVVQRNLEGGIAGARAAQSLLDEGAQRQHRLVAELIATDD